MVEDLGQIDLLDLSLASSLSQDKQETLLEKYSIALQGFLGKKLSEYFTDESDKEYNKLLKKRNVKEEDILNFWRKYIPSMEDRLYNLILEFKKLYLLRVYETMAQALENSQDIEHIKQKLLWETIIQNAKQDEWNNVLKLLELIPH